MRKLQVVTGITLGLVACLAGPWTAYRVAAAAGTAKITQQDWPVYGGPGGSHYSSLSQINRDNVKNLAVAWTFDTGEKGGLEASPIVVGQTLYTTTPGRSVIALDAVSGKQLWKFEADIEGRAITRGVSYWTDGHESRIFAGFRNYLYALDAATGKPVPSFGENGRVDLRKQLRGNYLEQSVVLTTPGTIYKDLIIVGGFTPETHPAPPGDVRAFDVRTGALRWTFHTIPHPGEVGYESWPKDAWKDAGSANNWAGMTVDPKKGVLYVPTGSAVFDFYGGDRAGDDLFADSLVALNADTGKLIWYFQGIHHDLWDHDFSQPPVLLTVNHNGKQVEAVAQASKSGYVFLLDRATGKSLFPIRETPVPASTVRGESAARTQPIPMLPAPLTQLSVTEDSLTNRTPEMHAWAVKQFRTFAGGEQYLPPSVDKLTAVMPGFAGGAEWGGSAIDPATGVLYVNANSTAWLVGLTVPPPPGSLGERVYQNQCSVCHGINRAGSPPAIPALRGIDGILTDKEIADTIHQGRGRMPPFNSLSEDEVQAVVRYLTRSPQQQSPRRPPTPPPGSSVEPVAAEGAGGSDDGMPFKTIGFHRFMDPENYPATAPPWGTFSAIDMNTGKYLWKIPFGEYPELAAKDTGSDNYGGPIVTAGGLLFIGATVFDQKFRAYDPKTGKVLWETELPFSGLATPTTYMVNGKQYIVIAAGGGQSSRKPSGGMFVAFALP